MSTYRIPPSLKWLIRNRQVIESRLVMAREDLTCFEKEIQRAEKIHQKYEEHKMRISILEADLAAIERSLLLHEIVIDVDKLRQLRPHKSPPVLQYGQLSRLIYSALGQQPNKWISTTEIVAFVASQAKFNGQFDSTKTFRRVVLDQLKGLSRGAKIDRVSSGRLYIEGFWRMKPPDRAGLTYLAVPLEDDAPANSLENSLTVQI